MIPVSVRVNLPHIAENAAKATALCEQYGIEVWGVTKAVAAQPGVARAMLDGGVTALAETRLSAVSRLYESGVPGPYWLLRSPAYCEIPECVALTDGSLVSDRGALELLQAEARRTQRRHGVLVMVDMATGREGFLPEEVGSVCRMVAESSHLDLAGLGIYFEWQGEADVQAKTLVRLCDLAADIGRELQMPLSIISGGSTSIIRTQLLHDRKPADINNLRLGTAILLGIASSVGPLKIPGFHQDTFELSVELNEVKTRGRRLGLLAMGHTDADPDYLFPLDPGVKVLKAFSDHTLVDLEEADPAFRAGETLRFQLGYFALTKLMHSPWVRHEFVR
ncbi:MAG: alanine racemase [Candidatus Krumholzibacteria bacterium]|nr:alanine racemase [Candidatus Krumholzibacteria bacterium]